MLLTEEEAKKKWCPKAISVDYSAQASGNVGALFIPCIASVCMMWRRDRQVTEKGWCGLAGPPFFNG